MTMPEEVAVIHTVQSEIADRTTEEAIAQSIIPYSRDDNRARYLGLRASGFTKREAVKFLGIAESTVSMWRTDLQFKECEDKLPEYRKQLSREYLNLEFLRNFRLILKKDFIVIKKSIEMPLQLTQHENQYLQKARAQYTPQQYQIVETIAGMKGSDFDFTRMVTELQRETVRITQEK